MSEFLQSELPAIELFQNDYFDDKPEILNARKETYETLKIGLLQKLLSGEVRV